MFDWAHFGQHFGYKTHCDKSYSLNVNLHISARIWATEIAAPSKVWNAFSACLTQPETRRLLALAQVFARLVHVQLAPLFTDPNLDKQFGFESPLMSSFFAFWTD